MKKLVLFMFILSVTLNLNSMTKKSKLAMDIINETTLEKVVEVDLSKEQIINKVEEWIQLNFTNESSSIQKVDKDKYYILGTGNLTLTWKNRRNSWTKDYYFKYRFDIKDNKFRFQIKNIYILMPYMLPSNEVINNTETIIKSYKSGRSDLEMISKMLTDKGIIEEIRNFVNGTTEDDSDW